MTHEQNAVVLLSGGMDSTVTAHIARAEGYRIHALTIRYGQRHACELQAAARVAHQVGALNHVTLDLDLRAFGGSALTSDIPVPHDRSSTEMSESIPVTYVPARNTIFLSLALAFAETRNASRIYIGVNALDYSGYPDCRPEFIDAFSRLARLATRSGVEDEIGMEIRTPLLEMSKAEIVRRGLELGVDFSLTHTCYDPSPSGVSCGRCDACQLRLKGFAEAGLTDPISYAIG